MASFNWVDYIILAIFLLSVLAGFGRGFVREMISLLTWVVAIIVAMLFASPLANVFTGTQTVQNLVTSASTSIGMNATESVSYFALGISFLILFVGVIIAGAIIGYIVNTATQTGGVGIVNRLLGGLFGLGRGFIIVLVTIFLLQLTPVGQQSFWQQSQFVISYQPAVIWLANIVNPALASLQSQFGQTIQNITSHIQGLSASLKGFSVGT